MHAYRLGIAAALAVAILASAASAADQFKITPPPGWVKKASDSGAVLAYWVEPNPDGFRQNLNLVDDAFAGTLAQYVALNESTLHKSAGQIVFGTEGDFKSCDGNHPAHFLSWKSAAFGHKLVFEQAMSVWYGRGYVLTYSRAEGQPERSDAQAALATLCVRQI